MLETLFNKVAGLKACNFIKKRVQHSLANLLKRDSNRGVLV